MGLGALLAEFLPPCNSWILPFILTSQYSVAKVLVRVDSMYFHAGLSLGHYGMAGEHR